MKLRKNVAQAEFLLPFNSLDPLLLLFGLPSCDKSFEILRHRPMTKAIIFDLDSCLAAADEVVVVRTGVCGVRRVLAPHV